PSAINVQSAAARLQSRGLSWSGPYSSPLPKLLLTSLMRVSRCVQSTEFVMVYPLTPALRVTSVPESVSGEGSPPSGVIVGSSAPNAQPSGAFSPRPATSEIDIA